MHNSANMNFPQFFIADSHRMQIRWWTLTTILFLNCSGLVTTVHFSIVSPLSLRLTNLTFSPLCSHCTLIVFSLYILIVSSLCIVTCSPLECPCATAGRRGGVVRRGARGVAGVRCKLQQPPQQNRRPEVTLLPGSAPSTISTPWDSGNGRLTECFHKCNDTSFRRWFIS